VPDSAQNQKTAKHAVEDFHFDTVPMPELILPMIALAGAEDETKIRSGFWRLCPPVHPGVSLCRQSAWLIAT
jgi:hypothetical protein